MTLRLVLPNLSHGMSHAAEQLFFEDLDLDVMQNLVYKQEAVCIALLIGKYSVGIERP